ncbi:MAG: hypothetical protein GY719_29135 [bacterium]|nr:hypothetical protein [bacterium]
MATESHPAELDLPATERFDLEGVYGEIVAELEPADLEGEIRRLSDPSAAEETIHWGRNYLYRSHLETPAGRVEVVVKQFRNQGLRQRLRRRFAGSKALRSWRIARAFQAAGLKTAEAVLLIESKHPEGASFFVSRYLDDMIEARYLLRAANRHAEAQEFPSLDMNAFLGEMGRVLARMHAAGFFHRDLSIGNVLVPARLGEIGPRDLYLIDLNRARRVGRLSSTQKTRDLCRLAIFRPEQQKIFLDAYWGDGGAGPYRTALYKLYHHGFLARIGAKKALRAWTGRVRDWFRPRRAHAHIPEAPSGASARDKIVWDHLSDQPHQHAGRLEKLTVRLADAPSHLRQTATFLAAMPRVWGRYRKLREELYTREVPWQGLGVCVRPFPEAPEALLAALDDLGTDKVLLRLHPWEDDHEAEADLAAELSRRGYDLAFSLPQNRQLVRDPERWRRKIEELGELFTPYGGDFQVGQAINRSKWGVWRTSEYLDLVASASEILRRYPDVRILGPAVIDFEYHVTTAILNHGRKDAFFDIVASLLYVDRRGAPEQTQLGFDTIGKVVLLKAIAETARGSGPESWVTEVNWPLWEGPHSPAGRTVSVDEDKQADYLARYYLLALATGAVERVYWWQLIARGYGLAVPAACKGSRTELIRRPAFDALATLARELRDSLFVRPLASPDGTYLYLFRFSDNRECVVGWSVGGGRRATLPRPAKTLVERGGERSRAPERTEVELSPAVRFFHL